MDAIRKQFLSTRRIDGDALKLIAAATMLIDHIAAVILWNTLPPSTAENYKICWNFYYVLRQIGRTAFPIFAFLLVEGFFHTRSRQRYLMRMLLSGVISEIPFNMAFYGEIWYERSQNVFWTLSLGFLVIWGLEKLYEKYIEGWNLMRKNGTGVPGVYGGRIKGGYQMAYCLAAVLLVAAGWFAATVLRTDYKGYGILLIVLFYFGKHAKVSRLVTCTCGYLLFLAAEPYCFGGFFLILLYNGTRKPRGKGFQYFFYLFYPLHLLILGLIRVVFLAG